MNVLTKCLLLVVVAAALLTVGMACAGLPVEAGTTVWLVRHAEKVDSTPASGLTAEGSARACGLAHQLQSAGIGTIHSSDYRRTRDTAAPLAERLGLEVALYDPRKLEGIAATLREAGGVHLVVGHSNTTPQLARLLGGEATDMDESVYHRLYRVTIDGDQVETLLLHTAAFCPEP